jgi:uroporphyrinogen decarboxylase
MHADSDCLFLKTCRHEEVPRPPVWMMRQAGRYLPEYRNVREGASFLEMCRRADLATEVTLQPIRRYDFDAAIIFSDILIPLIGMGAPFEFAEGGPKLPEGFDTAEKLNTLNLNLDPVADLPWTLEALTQTRVQLDSSKALLGFAGAPFTLFCYLVEGEGSRLFPGVKRMMFTQPELAESVLGQLADVVAGYLKAQLDAGADAVQLFDTWAGLLHPDDYARFALPYVKHVFAKLKDSGAPTIYYINGGPALLDQQIESGASILGIDWRQRMSTVRQVVPDRLGLQGNLDPLVLLAEPRVVARRTTALLEEMAGRRGYIVNLGHGVIPQTPLASVQAFVDAVRGREAAANSAN